MSRRIIAASLTYSSSANATAAQSRIASALTPYTYTGFTSVLSPGLNVASTVVTISIEVDDADAVSVGNAIYNAATSTNRPTLGYMSVNLIP